MAMTTFGLIDRDVVFGGVGNDITRSMTTMHQRPTQTSGLVIWATSPLVAEMPEFNDDEDSGDTDTAPVIVDLEGTSIVSFNFSAEPMDADNGPVPPKASTQGLPAPRAANWNVLSSSTGTVSSGIEIDATRL